MYGDCPAVETAKHRVLFLVVVVIFFFQMPVNLYSFDIRLWHLNKLLVFDTLLRFVWSTQIEQNPTYANPARGFENAPFCNYTEKIEFSRCSLLPLFVCLFVCSKALAKRTRKPTQVLDLRSNSVSFGHPLASTLHRLARTCESVCSNVAGFFLLRIKLACVLPTQRLLVIN